MHKFRKINFQKYFFTVLNEMDNFIFINWIEILKKVEKIKASGGYELLPAKQQSSPPDTIVVFGCVLRGLSSNDKL